MKKTEFSQLSLTQLYHCSWQVETAPMVSRYDARPMLSNRLNNPKPSIIISPICRLMTVTQFAINPKNQPKNFRAIQPQSIWHVYDVIAPELFAHSPPLHISVNLFIFTAHAGRSEIFIMFARLFTHFGVTLDSRTHHFPCFSSRPACAAQF